MKRKKDLNGKTPNQLENEPDAKSLLFVRHVLVGFKYRQVEFVK